MVSCCCGAYTVEAIRLDRGHGPRPLLKVSHLGYLVGYYHDADAVAAVLAAAGVRLA